jgi:hypothetical protein
VLAVVEQQEKRAAPQRRHQGIGRGDAAFLPDAEAGREVLWEERRIRERRQFDSREGAAALLLHAGRYLEGQPALPAPARPREREEPRPGEQSPQSRDLLFAADEWRELDGQRRRLHRRMKWETPTAWPDGPATGNLPRRCNRRQRSQHARVQRTRRSALPAAATVSSTSSSVNARLIRASVIT